MVSVQQNDYQDASLPERFRRLGGMTEVAKEIGQDRTSLRSYLLKEENDKLWAECKQAMAEHKLEKASLSPPTTLAPIPEVVGAGPNVEPDIQAIKEEAARRYRDKARRAEQKTQQKIRFAHGPVCIVFGGDQHIGNAGTDIERMFQEQELICAVPGSYFWQMGDVVDQFILGRLIAENWKPSLPVAEQWWLAEEYMKSFADRLLAVNAGNHDAWAQKASGVDRMRDISPDGVLYDADTIKATVEVGQYQFRIWTRHKWRGRSMYNMTHGQERGVRFDNPRYDVYVGAHNHAGAVARELIHNGSRKIAIQTGSYKVYDDYADAEGFPENDASTVCALILHEDGSFHATSDLRAALHFMRATYQGDST